MVAKPEHHRVEHQPREGSDPAWEVFVRADADAPLERAGTIPAPSADDAYEQARRLFAWYAPDIWLVPASEVRRYSVDPESERAEPVGPVAGDESRTHEV